MTDIPPPVNREILLAFWKVHILYHASERPVYGLWLMEELSEHGYRLSPGTLYPILERMERNGWLRSRQPGHVRSRRTYHITPEGRRVLEEVRGSIAELHDEVVVGERARRLTPTLEARHRRPRE
jgi:DNA-binding PadR family transcriptional regulator